jgi:bifunctional non-homologous end joining protein LigD
VDQGQGVSIKDTASQFKSNSKGQEIMSVASVSLYYKSAGSDKVYHAQIEEVSSGRCVVNFQYGRRGTSLQTGTKTATPVDSTKAQQLLDKLVQEKTSKGYTPAEDGTPYAGSDKAGQVSGHVPQLLNAIDEDLANRLIEDDDWMMQEKMDGVRLMNQNAGGTVTGSNRKGLVVAISTLIESRLQEPPCQAFVVDGEAIGDTYWMFDLLEDDELNHRNTSALSRWFLLKAMFGNYDKDYSAIRIVDSYLTTGEKRAAFDRLRAAKAEGVVFKRKDSLYVPGRPSSGGDQLKFKFVQSCTCFVRAINEGKRSVVLGMENGTELVGIGNATIPANLPIPNEGELVEVRYLYAYPGGSLYQPVYLGVRTDLVSADDINVLKYKQGTTEEEA